MKIKRFVADDISSAVVAVRRELGGNAVILTTQSRPRPGWRKLFRRYDRMEVTAAVDGGARQVVPSAAPEARLPVAAPVPPTPARLDVSDPHGPDGLRAALYGEVGAGVSTPRSIRPQAGTRLVVMLLGPTGAGKTTTAAKLAAHLHLQQGWRVGLCTADNFRLGAVEQLAAYAHMLSLPLEVAPTPGALDRALERLHACDVILVDTAGRGHRDAKRMRELAGYAPAAAAVPASGTQVEWHLVMAAGTRRAEAEAVVLAYRQALDRPGVRLDSLLLTKLDECEATPDPIGLVAATGLCLSYFTAGQRVPEDLGLAWPDRMAEVLRR